MINTPLQKILFIDIETVGISSDFDNFKKDYPSLSYQFENYLDWFQKRFPEDLDKSKEQIFVNRAALVPEFCKIVCVSMGFVDPKGEVKKQTFFNSDEKTLLTDVNNLLKRVDKLGFILCGHNIKNFDIPVLAKRMLINGVRPSSILPSYDTKPWDIKAIDTKEIWQYGQFGAICSLELMCISLGVESSKNMEVTGNKVHDAFWVENKYQEIQDYCEKDVDVLINVVMKIKSI
jgi:predicted PolB exonuclease-like 3'-5' exonuclease